MAPEGDSANVKKILQTYPGPVTWTNPTGGGGAMTFQKCSCVFEMSGILIIEKEGNLGV